MKIADIKFYQTTKTIELNNPLLENSRIRQKNHQKQKATCFRTTLNRVKNQHENGWKHSCTVVEVRDCHLKGKQQQTIKWQHFL